MGYLDLAAKEACCKTGRPSHAAELRSHRVAMDATSHKTRSVAVARAATSRGATAASAPTSSAAPAASASEPAGPDEPSATTSTSTAPGANQKEDEDCHHD